MTQKVRRSWLLVPASDDRRVEGAYLAGADVVVLDLVEFVFKGDKPAARENLEFAVARVGTGRLARPGHISCQPENFPGRPG